MKALLLWITLICLGAVTTQAQNLVSSSSWTIGSGSVGIFGTNGLATENIRELGVGPHGDQVLLWKAAPDGNAQADGGWDTGWFPIDHTKMYRFSVWIKKTNSTDGTTYFGCRASDILSLSGTVNSNPYFWAGDLPALDKWYLLVGYIHASTDASTTNYGGIYDGETGSKIETSTDYKFSSSATVAVHRTYLYYDANTSDRQYFYGPDVYEVESNQPLTEFNSSAIFNGDAYFSKRIGVGTTNPLSTLHMVSSIATDRVSIQGTLANSNVGFMIMNSDGSERWSMASIYDRNYLQFYRAGHGDVLVLNDDGNVGIGTTTPNEKLTVNGTVYAKEVKVDLSVPGPDYVFSRDYALPPLEEVKKFIDRHGHLPDVPSAKEMETNGIKTGEMNMLLLKKIEELTLYVLQLQTENKRQDQLIRELQNK